MVFPPQRPLRTRRSRVDDTAKTILAGIGGLVVLAGLFVVYLAIDMFFAQLTAWALAEYHIHSGLYGPFMFIMVASFVIGGSVTTGVKQALKSKR